MTFDFSPGAQVPRTDVPLQAGVTAALSTGAYRDGPVADFDKIQPSVGETKGKVALFQPNMGEAFTRAVLARTLNSGRKPVVPSFGADPRPIVEHCVEAYALRLKRDRQLTLVFLITGLIFLPGTILWLIPFELRFSMVRHKVSTNRENFLSSLLFTLIAGIAAYLAYKPPAGALLGYYLRIVLLVPVIGGFIAYRICRKSTEQLRERWTSLLEGGGIVGAQIPQAVPTGPEDQKAEQLRTQLSALLTEQETNILHYAGPKGPLGLGRRWGVWRLAEELVPKPGVDEIRDFRAWDIARRVADQLNDLQRPSVPGSGIPHPMVRNWVVMPLGEGADEFGRPSGPEMDGPRMRDFDVQQICNAQQFGRGPRHYLGVQFVGWEGQCVITLLCRISFLHHTLNIEVSGYALGAVDSLFSGKPKGRTKKVQKSIKRWEEREISLPLIGVDEMVRLSVRAPLHRIPGLRDWLGGTMKLPEPFGLRSAWAKGPWSHRFQADDAIDVAIPVLRAIHSATLRFLADQDVDLTRFDARALGLSGEVQGVRPSKADVYDAE